MELETGFLSMFHIPIMYNHLPQLVFLISCLASHLLPSKEKVAVVIFVLLLISWPCWKWYLLLIASPFVTDILIGYGHMSVRLLEKGEGEAHQFESCPSDHQVHLRKYKLYLPV